MRVIRAYDGRSIVVNQPLSQFASLDDLLDCLSLATEIPSDAIICMTSDGSQLKQELLDRIIQQTATSPSASASTAIDRPPLSSSLHQDPQNEAQNHEFFVYNREFLYTDPTELAAELAEHTALEPAATIPDAELSFPPTPKSLEALVAWSAQVAALVATHEQSCRDLLEHITLIARSLQVALANLRDHADNIEKGAKALIDDVAQKELKRMQSLLQGYERDLRILAMVSIHPRLQSTSAQMANAAAAATSSTSTQNGNTNGQSALAKPKHRTLGDYISKSKMSAVADACNRVYSELRERIERIDSDLSLIRNDTLGLSEEVESTTPEVADETYQRVLEAEARTRQLHAFIHSTCSPDSQGWPVADKIDAETFDEIARSANELMLLDEVVREGVQRLTQDRNDILERSLHLLIDISGIQSEFTETGSLLAAVDADLHSNKLDGFKHLHRLKNMLWAYGATVVEVVRRREFAKHFLGKSQSLAELMAKVSASEWKRRQFYRTDVSSLLPWEVKGMDDKPPSLEITTPRVSSEGMADLGMTDLQSLYELLDQVDQRLRQESDGAEQGADSPIPEVKAALQALAAALQDLDDEFIHLVHHQLLNRDDDDEASDEDGDESGSDTSIRARKRLRHRQRLTASLAAANNQEVAQLRAELATAKSANEEAERALKADNDTRVVGLRAEIETLKRQVETGKADVCKLEAEKRDTQGHIDALAADLELERERRLNMVDEVNQLRRDLEQSYRNEAEAKQEAMEEADRVAELEAQAHELHVELEEAKTARIDASKRIEALLSEGSSAEGELRTAQARIDELTEQLSNAHAEAAKAREAAAEVEAAKERQIRSHRAEADGDRAILEEKVRALKADLDAKEKLLEKQAAIATRAEESRIPDREAIELLRGQLRAADVAHEEIVKEMEQAKELADDAEAARRVVEATRQQLLEFTRGLLARATSLRRAVRAMPTHSSSRQASSSSAAQTADKNAAGAASTPALVSSTSGAAAAAQRAIAALTGSLSVSELSESQRQAALDAFDAEAESATLETTLEALRAFDVAEMYDEVKGKLDSFNVVVRKWQKAWKSANDKANKANHAAKEKIAFKNFQVGDLALFLPTRSSNLSVKPWAAFNISFPHFFLNAKGTLAEQLRTKEWIVARITSINNKVVPVAGDGLTGKEDEVSDEDPNPFKLPEGVRFFMLDVETYGGHGSAPPALRSRKSSSAVVGGGAVPSDATNGHTRASHKREPPSHPRSQSEGAVTGLKGVSDESKTAAPSKAAPLTIEPSQLDTTSTKVEESMTPKAAGDESFVPDVDPAAETSGFSLRSDKLDVPEQSTPPMQTPDTSPRLGLTAVFSAPASAEKGDKMQHSSTIVESRSATSASGLTRALRSSSPASSFRTEGALSSGGGGGASAIGRWRASSSASTNTGQWPSRNITGIAEESDPRNRDGNDGDASSTTGSASHRSTLIEHATIAPAFGRTPNKRRFEAAGRAQTGSPSGRAAARRHGGAESPETGSFDGRGVTSAPASQSRSEGIAIRSSRPVHSDLSDTAVSNPFSQSPGPASLPADRDGMGTLGRGQARRKSSLYISSTATTDGGGERDGGDTGSRDAPKVQRWPSDAVSRASQRTTSSASTASTSNQPGGIRINGRSIVFDTSGPAGAHRRQASSSTSVATTAVTTAHAIPGAFPSSFSSSGSLAGPGSPSVGQDRSEEAGPSSSTRQVWRSPSFSGAGSSAAASSSRPALASAQKPSFLSQTLGRFTGAAVQAVQAPPFAPIASDSGAATVGKSSSGRNSQSRPSLFQAVAPMHEAGSEAQTHRGTPESAVSGVSGNSNVSGHSAEGMLKRLHGQQGSSQHRG
ncbi:related to ATG11-required for mitophagy [Sporisorium reilianum f. sp. reilianum]|uniref:Autophagy-related protein 11 n=1 Tax=Sporisorium reilianum f. sp. reilianum TaxID=72559 RepID=A0A2N8UFP9_9BASI|nr:related to ATG11-required for mitophagy [Sporisorium reilianum f. sp. reilianum]